MNRNDAVCRGGNWRRRALINRATMLGAIALLVGTLVLGPPGTYAYPGMGKTCSTCHKDGTSGSVETRDGSGTAATSFQTAPSGTVTVVVAGSGLPDDGGFVALEMGTSYDIVQSFSGAKNSGDPGTLYVINADENDREPGDTAVRASIVLTLKASAADGSYQAKAVVGYKGPEGVSQSAPVTINVASAPSNTAPSIGTVSYPATVYTGAAFGVQAPVSDDGGVTAVVLRYKAVGADQYTSLDMALVSGDAKDGTWGAQIPGQDAAGAISFNINATDGELFAASPAAGDHSVQVLQPGNPEITHQPVTTGYIGSAIVINATAREAGSGVFLYFREIGGSAHVQLAMNRTDGGSGWPADFSAAIPAQTAKGTVRYHINATNGTLWTATPDFAIDIVSLWEPELSTTPVATAVTGSATSISAEARNAASVTLWCKGVGESFFRSKAMDRAGAGPNGTQKFSAFLPAQNATGTMSYYLNATNGTLYASTQVYTVQVAEALDLVLEEITLSEKEPAIHEELIIKARVRNNSTRELSGVQVSFLDLYYPPGDMRYIGLVSNLTIPAKSTITVRAWWLPQVNGTHSIKVTVDSTGVVKETDEGNNEMVKEVEVGPARGEGIVLPSLDTLAPLWPVFAVTIGFLIGVAAFLSRRPSR